MTTHDEQSAIMAGVVQGIWDEHDARKCEIQADDSGWYILSDGGVVADGMITCGDAVHEAAEQGLVVLNTEDVERWMQPPNDWGIAEEPTNDAEDRYNRGGW